MLDFISIPKIDAHIHYNYDRSTLCKLGDQFKFRFLTINTDVPFFPSLEVQQRISKQIRSQFPGSLDFICTFETSSLFESDWSNRAISQIQTSLNSGAIGVKVWKNIGMNLRDPSGNLITIDNPLFDPVFDFLEKEKITVIGHLGEPRNCWLPVDKMTVASDRNYFSAHPEYHMHLHPEFPDYSTQIRARNLRLHKNPDLRFVGAHLASLEWNVDEISKWLKEYHGCAVDLAERINHLQLQSITNHKKIREFFEAYQDRIIYGTDIIDDGSMSEEQLVQELTNRWLDHWNFFSSGEPLSSPEFPGTFHGLNLTPEILAKIYQKNASNWYGF